MNSCNSILFVFPFCQIIEEWESRMGSIEDTGLLKELAETIDRILPPRPLPRAKESNNETADSKEETEAQTKWKSLHSLCLVYTFNNIYENVVTLRRKMRQSNFCTNH